VTAPKLSKRDLDVMTPGEVAALCRVEPKTITRWADEGKLPFFRTIGGHRRFHRADVELFERRRRDSKRRGIW